MVRSKDRPTLSVFLSQNTNLIEYPFGIYPDPVTGNSSMGFRADNIEQSRVFGYELEFQLNRNFGKLNSTLSGGYTYLYPVEFNQVTGKNSDIYLKYRRKHSSKISLNTTYNRFVLGLNLYYKSKILGVDDVFVNEATRESILPGFYSYWIANNTGYFMADLNLGYQINEMLNLSLQ